MIVDETYHDDPEFEGQAKQTTLSKGKLFVGLALVAGFFIQTTFAANINLSSTAPTEFGQGVQLTTACSGNIPLTLTPNVGLVNSSGAGAFYLNSVTVSNIPAQCHGVDFSISAYDGSSNTPLSIFNTSSNKENIIPKKKFFP